MSSDTETSRADDIRDILNLFEETTDETESSNLCEELVKIVSKGGKEERFEALTDLVEILEESIIGQGARRACIYLCKAIQKQGVLPIIAEMVLSELSSEIIDEKILSDPSVYLDLLKLADSSVQNLKYIIEIIYCILEIDDVITVFPHLLSKVKIHWKNEKVMHGVVKLLVNTIEDCEDEQMERIIDLEILNTMTVLMGLLFSQKPSSMKIGRTMAFPRYQWQTEHSLVYLLADAIHSSEILEFEDHEYYAKIIRPIIPILSFTFQQISEKYQKLIKVFDVRDFLINSIEIVVPFISHSNDLYYYKDLKLLLSSKLFDRLLTLFEKSTPDKCCYAGYDGPCANLQDCKLFEGVMVVVKSLQISENTKHLTKEERIERVKLFQRILNDKRCFKWDGLDVAERKKCNIVISSEVADLGL